MDLEKKEIIKKLLNEEKYHQLKTLCEPKGLTLEELNSLIYRIGKERIELAKQRKSVIIKLNYEFDEEAKAIIVNVYYMLYHFARAYVFIVSHKDEHDHKHLNNVFRNILNGEDKHLANILEELRKCRNQIDYYPVPDLGENTDICILAKQSLQNIWLFEKLIEKLEGIYGEKNI